MATPKKTMVISRGEAEKLSKIHEEYLENAPRLNWTERGVLIHMDTWCIDTKRPLLQHERPEVVGKGKMTMVGNNVMLN